MRDTLFHKRLPKDSRSVTSPHLLPRHHSRPRHDRHIIPHSSASSRPRRTLARSSTSQRRHCHYENVVTTVERDVQRSRAVPCSRHTDTRTVGRVRVSAPRSRVKYVKILWADQRVSASHPQALRPIPSDHRPGSPLTEFPNSRLCRQVRCITTRGPCSPLAQHKRATPQSHLPALCWYREKYYPHR